MTKPEANIEGRWQMVRAELAGERAPELVVQHTELEMRDGRYTVRFDGEVVDGGTYTFVEQPKTSVLTFHGKLGLNANRRIPCISQLANSRLRICFGLDGTTPENFATNECKARYLATYRRTP